MRLAEKLREMRVSAGLTQRELAQEAGVTSGFVAQIEMGDRLPSLDVLLRLSSGLGLKRADQDEVISLYEEAQEQKLQQAVRTRGVAVRGVLRTRGVTPKVPSSEALARTKVKADEIATEIAGDPELLSAYKHLRGALADPGMRRTVLATLEAWAKEATQEK